MKIKKLLSIIFIFVFAFAVTACSKGDDSATIDTAAIDHIIVVNVATQQSKTLQKDTDDMEAAIKIINNLAVKENTQDTEKGELLGNINISNSTKDTANIGIAVYSNCLVIGETIYEPGFDFDSFYTALTTAEAAVLR